jgi:hypothetical protein
VSKRSYRRLAVVAGAALAVGSMAPAMAARVDGEATVSANTIDATELAGSLVPTLSSLNLVNTQFVGQLSASLLGTPFAVLGGVQNAVGETLDCAGSLVSGVGLGLDADATAVLGLGGLNLDIAGVLTGVTSATGVVGCATGAVVPAALGIVGTAAAPVSLAAGAALQTVGSLPATVGQVTGTVFGLQDLLLSGLSASGSLNVLAGVMGTF